ncbi:hypothetical protein [Brevibacillus daliensis]|uniref:hypothetical protein n=1 Tax=Brevibacillus daliensis TaxID=2892995 RepID=UPI001E60BE9D|nr:hypothetical protein [Brevibacillus daliensis]
MSTDNQDMEKPYERTNHKGADMTFNEYWSCLFFCGSFTYNDYFSGVAEEAHFLSANSLRSRKGAMTVRYRAKSEESAKG